MLQDEKRVLKEMAESLARAETVNFQEDAERGVGTDSMVLPVELKIRRERLAKCRSAREAMEHEARQARAAELREPAAAHRQKAAAATDEEDWTRVTSLAARQEAAAAEIGVGPLAPAAGVVADGGPSSERSDDKLPNEAPPGASALPEHRVKHRADGTPDEKAQRNFTDPTAGS
ncbi:MAG: hypothetical protein H6732_06730 [Alphaproteobacteria bacterium]|nr:hypothetical protein [Alphaproteobacteria bacterium]